MKKFLPILHLFAIFLLAACSSSGNALAPAPPQPTAAFIPATLLPTSTPELQLTNGCPNVDCVFPRPTPDPAQALRLSLPTPGEDPISAWRPPQYPVPLALGQFDHFYMARPIAADEINWPVANYRYGGTDLSPDITHTGVDIPSQEGTPVLASGPGVVTWADWGLFSGTPGNQRDPYGMAVAIRHDFGWQGKPLFTVYAHLRSVDVTMGQWVNTGEKLGEVGDTGYTTGPHLHFELRLGKDSYYNTRNPELWLAPPQNWGVLAGRVLDSGGSPAHNIPVSIRSLDMNLSWVVNTYGPEAINPDDYYNENMVISDLPAGKYEIIIAPSTEQTERIEITIRPGQVTYFVYRATFGFTSTAMPPAVTPTAISTEKPN